MWLDTQDARSRDRNPSKFYVRLSVRPLGQQAYHVWLREILRYYVATAAAVCLHFSTIYIYIYKLYKLDEPDTQDTAGEARTNSSVMYSCRPPHMAKQKQDDQLEHTYSSYVRIRGVALKTCQKRWSIGRSGERGSGISVLAARHDDDDDTQPDLSIYLSIRAYEHVFDCVVKVHFSK